LKLIVNKFQFKDLKELTEEMVATGFDIDSIRVEDKQIAYTVRTEEGEILGIGGVHMFWPGVGEGWVILTKVVFRYPLTFHKTVLGLLGRIEAEYGFSRIQAACLCGWNRAEKWLQKLGFEYEGIMAKYGPDGSDYYRYARIR